MTLFSDNRLDDAYNLLLDGELQQAANLYEERLREQPESICLIMELANIYYMLGLMAKSVVYYERAQKLKPGSPYIMYKMGVALYRSTHFTRANEVFNQIVESEKYIPMTYLWLGLSYYHLGKESKSIEAYKTLLSLCPDTMMANYYMGVALKASGKYDKAIKHFEKLINKTDQHVSALYHLGRTHMQKHNYEKARAYFKRVIDLDPENESASTMLEYLSME